MKKNTTLILICATLVLAVSSKLVELDLNNAKHVEMIKGGPLKLEVGDEVRMVVSENPTTGYIWMYQSEPKTNPPVFVVSHDVHKQDKIIIGDSSREDSMEGVGGTRVLELKAINAGKDSFELVHARPWEF